MARQNNSHRSGLGGHLDLGNAHVLPVSGIETVKVHPRNELPQDAEFGRAVDRASVKEKSFYEGRIFTFAKDLINASNCPRAVEILGAAEQGGGLELRRSKPRTGRGSLGRPRYGSWYVNSAPQSAKARATRVRSRANSVIYTKRSLLSSTSRPGENSGSRSPVSIQRVQPSLRSGRYRAPPISDSPRPICPPRGASGAWRPACA